MGSTLIFSQGGGITVGPAVRVLQYLKTIFQPVSQGPLQMRTTSDHHLSWHSIITINRVSTIIEITSLVVSIA